MRDVNRIKPFVNEIADIWTNNCPDWRFGQFMYNFLSVIGDLKMRDVNRIKPFMNELGDIWAEKCPDWRFGQLMYNFLSVIGDPFYIEEDEFLECLKLFFKENEK